MQLKLNVFANLFTSLINFHNFTSLINMIYKIIGEKGN